MRNAVLREDCVRLGSAEPCYLMLRLRQERDELAVAWPHLSGFPFKKSVIRCGNMGILDGREDHQHMEYEGRNEERIRHVLLLEKEL